MRLRMAAEPRRQAAYSCPASACIAVVLYENRRHPLAIFETLARHWHQELQGYLRRDLAFAHLMLDRVRQQFRQRQPP